MPILLAYVYGVVPISLCRSGGCGVTTSSSGVKIIDLNDDNENDTLAGGINTAPGETVLKVLLFILNAMMLIQIHN